MTEKNTDIADILRQLVSFPVLGGESNLSIIHWIKEYIESFGVITQLVHNSEHTKASLHCRIGPAIDGGILLSGHTDVVPVAGQNWKSDPFLLEENKDGKYFGRGTCDMKGFIACCLHMLPEFVKKPLKTPLYFAFSYDEEIGCLAAPDLIKHIQDFYKEQPKFAIIGEPSLMQPIIGHKGICVFETHVNGSAGHSSGILNEVSAIHETARLILWLEAKMETLVANGHLDSRFTPPHSSIHIGIIKGGIAANVIADTASFSWDARVIPQDSISQIITDFRNYCDEREKKLQQKFPDFRITTTEKHPPVPALDTKENTAIVSLLKKINPNHFCGTAAYAAEAGQFSLAGIESIICGPGSIKQAHRADEYISKQQLNACIHMLKKLTINLLK